MLTNTLILENKEIYGKELTLLNKQIEFLEKRHVKVNEKIYSLRKELMDSQPFEILEFAVTGQNIKPNKTLNITISAILGLMMGVFIAFFQEFWQKSKN